MVLGMDVGCIWGLENITILKVRPDLLEEWNKIIRMFPSLSPLVEFIVLDTIEKCITISRRKIFRLLVPSLHWIFQNS